MTEMLTGQQFKACCAAAYSEPWVALLLGDSYHPGGLALTRHLAKLLTVPRGGRILDVASGRGASALAIAAEHPVSVVGVDLSAENVAVATNDAGEYDASGRVSFRVGDAESLPVGSAEFDAVICECALCTFPDKRAAVAEMVRVLRPGGRLGLTDVTAIPERLPARLQTLLARVACVGAATTSAGYQELLAEAGLHVEVAENHDLALARLVDRIEARLLVVDMVARTGAAPLFDRAEIDATLAEAKAAMADGLLGYTLVVARKPTTTR